MLDIAGGRRKTLKKGKEKRKMRKCQTIKKMFSTIIFFCRKNYFLLENIFGKNHFKYYYIYTSIFLCGRLIEMQ